MSTPQRSLTQSNPVADDVPFVCEDCGFEGLGHFCQRCGQARVAPPKTLWGLLGDFISQYFNLEGKLWQTLWLLLSKPGALTQAYFAGKRTRYFTPVRLYLTLSLIFFTATALLGPSFSTSKKMVDSDEMKSELAEAEAEVKAAQKQLDTAKDADDVADAREELIEAEVALSKVKAMLPASQPAATQFKAERKKLDLWWLPGADVALDKLLDKVAAGEEEKVSRKFYSALMSAAPRVLFVLLPLFAAFFKWAFRKRCYYVEAFVFTLHLHSVAFIAAALAVFLPSGLVAAASVVYGVLAMKRVFAQSWARTIGKGFFVAVLYSVLLSSVTGWLAYRAALDL